MVDGKLLIEKLLAYAKARLHLCNRDEIYFRNLLMREFKVEEPLALIPDLTEIENLSVPDLLVGEIEEYALENQLIEKGEENLYSTYVMGMLCPLPSVVNAEFNRIRESQGGRR